MTRYPVSARYATFPLLVALLILSAPLALADTAEELIEQARKAFADGQPQKAIELADKAVEAAPKDPQTYYLRGQMFETLRRPKQAVADYSKVLQLDPEQADAYHRRGCELFKAGLFEESIRDFDTFLEKKPDRKPSHWQRGISCYYAGRYKEGQEQFEGYQKFDSNDVENAVWRYLCMAPRVGKKKARAELLKIGEDKRIPMRQVYDLFAGEVEPDDVLAACQAGEPTKEELSQRLFYAHLYLGLYAESEADPKAALEHLRRAALEYPIGHYMWDVARVHHELLQKKLKDKAPE